MILPHDGSLPVLILPSIILLNFRSYFLISNFSFLIPNPSTAHAGTFTQHFRPASRPAVCHDPMDDGAQGGQQPSGGFDRPDWNSPTGDWLWEGAPKNQAGRR
jgi:hypothetical protein